MITLSRTQWRLLALLDELSLWLWPPRMRRRLRDAEEHVSELRLRLTCANLALEAMERGETTEDPRPEDAR
jgi:hypothetical protein